MKTKDIKQELSDIDLEQLPDANAVKQAREAALEKTQQDVKKKDEAKKNYANKANAIDKKREKEKREKQSYFEADPNSDQKQGRHDADLRQQQLYKMNDQHRDELIEFDHYAANMRRKENKKLDVCYGTKEAKRELRDAENALKANSGFFARIIGKTAKLSEKVEVLKLNRESEKRSRGYSMGGFNKRLEDEKKKILDKHKEEHRYFENSSTKKLGTAKEFEKAVLKKDTSKQNQKSGTRDKGHDNDR